MLLRVPEWMSGAAIEAEAWGNTNKPKKRMKQKSILSALLALGLCGLTASACPISVFVHCPNGNPISGVEVCADNGGDCQTTDSTGIAVLSVPDVGTYNVCITLNTLPQGGTPDAHCKQLVITDPVAGGSTDFTINGVPSCGVQIPGACWMTGGGTIGKVKTPDYSFGGVVYPGCSPKAAEGGNWNVVAHKAGLHFQGQIITVDSCSGPSNPSPKVTVNTINFHGTGRLFGVGGNPLASEDVSFVAQAMDISEPGHGIDTLFLSVTDSSGVVLQIGDSTDSPAVLSTGNIQIHQSGCGKF
jgi:hypothetical protein